MKYYKINLDHYRKVKVDKFLFYSSENNHDEDWITIEQAAQCTLSLKEDGACLYIEYGGNNFRVVNGGCTSHRQLTADGVMFEIELDTLKILKETLKLSS